MTSPLLTFATDTDSDTHTTSNTSNEAEHWLVLVVDDEPSVHEVTQIVFRDFLFENKPVKLLHAASAAEAKTLMDTHDEFAVMLIDVVMETDNAGLELVNYVRQERCDQMVRIILRTGQPGTAPEASIVSDYDINDYRCKSELTVAKLVACVTNALRSYRDLVTIRELVREKEILQKDIEKNNQDLLMITWQLRGEIQQKNAVQKALSQSNSKLESIINNRTTPISLKSPDGRYELVNRAFTEQLKVWNVDIIGRRDSDLFCEDIAAMIRYNDQKVCQSLEPLQCEEVLPSKAGDHFYLCVKFPIFDNSGKFVSLCTICTDIAERLDAQIEMIQFAQYDSLTNLPNRSLFIDRVIKAVEHNQRNQKMLAVLFIDLDHFKFINDSLGHEYGDKILIGVAQRLQSLLRTEDSVCRLGGDEFAVLLSHLSHEADLVNVTEKIYDTLAAPYEINNRTLEVTPSIGVSRCPENGTDVHELLKKADIAMYKAKKSGRNGYRLYMTEDDLQVQERMNLESVMRDTLENDLSRLQLVYMPTLGAHTKVIQRVSAIVRWQHPERGELGPESFIPIMDEIGLSKEIGHWVIAEACRFAARQYSSGQPLIVSLALSPRQIKQEELVKFIKQTLDETGCPASCLEFEITEQVLVHNCTQVQTALEALSDFGVRIAISDFGVHFTALNVLKQLPISAVKTHKELTLSAVTSEHDKALLQTIINFIHHIEIDVIVDGVSNIAAWTLVGRLLAQKHNCFTQGAFISKPAYEAGLQEALMSALDVWQQRVLHL